MKKVRKVFGIVLCMALLLTAVSFAKPVTVEAASKSTTITVTKTSGWASGAYVTIENKKSTPIYVSVSGGYAAKDGRTIKIPAKGSKKFSYGLCSCKGAMFRLYLTSSADLSYWTYTKNCKIR